MTPHHLDDTSWEFVLHWHAMADPMGKLVVKSLTRELNLTWKENKIAYDSILNLPADARPKLFFRPPISLPNEQP